MNLTLWLALALGLFVLQPVQANEESLQLLAIGSFSNMRFTEEHQAGSEIELLREGAELFGLFFYSGGRLMGDIPAGLLQDIRYNPKTRTISFTSKLTTGQHFCNVHKNGLPSRDLFSFQGKLSDVSMSGVLKHSDALHPENPPTKEKVVLTRMDSEAEHQHLYSNRADWEATSKMILQFRGPKW